MRKLEPANFEGDKYELEGWIDDIDENQAGSNLLKILENKITVPFFPKTKNFKVQNEDKLNKVPPAKPMKKNSILLRVLSKNSMNYQSETTSNTCALKNSKSEKVMGISANLEEGPKIPRYIKQPIWVKNQRFLELFKNQKVTDGQNKQKKVNLKHKRLSSSISLSIKQKSSKKSIFPRLKSQKHIHIFQLKGKPLSHDKQYLSNQKQTRRNVISISCTQKIKGEEMRIRQSLQVPITSIFPREFATQMVRLRTEGQKPRSKDFLNSVKRSKIAKTENCYFMDEHLQPSRQKR